MEKVVVVGSLHYDIFVEAPRRPVKGETLIGYRYYPKFGGKGGNQAVAAAKAGCAVTMVSAVGQDSFAPHLLEVLKYYHIDTQFVQRLNHVGSGMSVAIMDDEGDYGAVVVSGSNLLLDNSSLSKDSLWQDAKMLILQNEVSPETNLVAAQEAKKRGIPVCINAAPVKPMSDELKALIDILIVNQVEAEGLCGVKVDSLNEALVAAKKLAENFKQVVVTAGGDGVAYATQDGLCVGSMPAHKVKLISTHGAGDCFVGHLCAALVKGQDLQSAVKEANYQSAQHVSTAHDNELERIIHAQAV